MVRKLSSLSLTPIKIRKDFKKTKIHFSFQCLSYLNGVNVKREDREGKKQNPPLITISSIESGVDSQAFFPSMVILSTNSVHGGLG